MQNKQAISEWWTCLSGSLQTNSQGSFGNGFLEEKRYILLCDIMYLNLVMSQTRILLLLTCFCIRITKVYFVKHVNSYSCPSYSPYSVSRFRATNGTALLAYIHSEFPQNLNILGWLFVSYIIAHWSSMCVQMAFMDTFSSPCHLLGLSLMSLVVSSIHLQDLWKEPVWSIALIIPCSLCKIHTGLRR